jgi:hypothetical protein
MKHRQKTYETQAEILLFLNTFCYSSSCIAVCMKQQFFSLNFLDEGGYGQFLRREATFDKN